MLKKLLRNLINFFQWFFDRVLTAKQRKFIKNRLTDKQKQYIKRKFRMGKTQTRLRIIEELKIKLKNLGFTEKAYKELIELLENSNDFSIKKLAAWELAIWHANQNSEKDARKCLEFLKKVLEVDNDRQRGFLRRIAILKAESLEILGKVEEAKRAISAELKASPHPDLYLAYANLVGSETEKIEWINKAVQMYGISKVSLANSGEVSAYDRLSVSVSKDVEISEQTAKVTVIIPVYNAEDVIHTSLNSILSQTWSNLEVLVVDDCSKDNTVNIIKEFEARDKRVQLIQTDVNGGAYVARNHALNVATGEFVTINDADDWSHSEKIEIQVRHLIQNTALIGCTSQQARTTNDLKFFRRGKPGEYLFSNMSSFMFRLEPVKSALGYWDCVRFGADSEFIKRIKKVFGDRSIVELPTGPLSFQRQSNTSLTGNSAFGFPGYFMGARKEYLEAQIYYHANSENLYYDFPQQRPFAIPEPMWPTREEKKSERRHFDVIIVSDYRLDGGSNMSNVEEIKAHKQLGIRTGLIQMARYDYYPKKKINGKIRELINGKDVQMIVYGEKVSCDLLILRYPPILQEWQKYVPDVEAKKVNVIVNQTPMSDYGPAAQLRFNLIKSKENLKNYFGDSGVWYPIGPLVREALHTHHQEEITHINLSEENWYNIINLDEWKRESTISRNKAVVKIGRHSRGHEMKWPSNPEQMLEIYPDSKDIEVHILGGAEVPKKVLGEIPENWHVLKFGEVSPKQFLETLDVFVYFTHPDWVESFGRVIIEAMAVGVPAIVSPSYKELFGEAAIYAEPSEVQSKIQELMADEELYQAQVKKAHAYIEANFGYSMHGSRIECEIQQKNYI